MTPHQWFQSIKQDLKAKSAKPAPAAGVTVTKGTTDLLADRIYQEIKEQKDPAKRIPLCQRFLNEYGSHEKRPRVKEFLEELARKDLKAIQKQEDPATRIQLCETFLNNYGPLKNECAAVEDLLAQARKEHSVEEAKKAYVIQMQGKADPKYNPGNKFGLKQATPFAKTVAAGDLSDPTGRGLSEAEVLAVKTYSVDDYKYINPAVANQKDKAEKTDALGHQQDWMDKHKKARAPEEVKIGTRDKWQQAEDEWQKEKKERYQEGALHAGMAVEGLKKLKTPKKGKMIYRGSRMTPEEFARDCKPGNAFTYEAFASTSTDKDVAFDFSTGKHDRPLDPKKTIAVVVEAKVYDARDIQELALKKSENELLALPGTKLLVLSVDDDPALKSAHANDPAFKPDASGKPKLPPATAWKCVKCEQQI